MPNLVCRLRNSATFSKLWYGGPGEVVPSGTRCVPDGEECRWATIPRLSAAHQVCRSNVGCVQAENEAESAQIIFGDAVRICAQRVEKLCKARRTRLNQCGEATAQRTKSCTRRHRIKAAQETGDAEAAAARTARRTPSQRIHAADPRWIGEPFKVVATLNFNLTTTLRSSRDGRCGDECAYNARGKF
jgi:hypothetical protein